MAETKRERQERWKRKTTATAAALRTAKATVLLSGQRSIPTKARTPSQIRVEAWKAANPERYIVDYSGDYEKIRANPQPKPKTPAQQQADRAVRRWRLANPDRVVVDYSKPQQRIKATQPVTIISTDKYRRTSQLRAQDIPFRYVEQQERKKGKVAVIYKQIDTFIIKHIGNKIPTLKMVESAGYNWGKKNPKKAKSLFTKADAVAKITKNAIPENIGLPVGESAHAFAKGGLIALREHPTEALAFAAIPPALKLVGAGAKAAGITAILTKTPARAYVTEKSLQLVSGIIGATYINSVRIRVTAPVTYTYLDGKVIREYERERKNGEMETVQEIEQIPVTRKPTRNEQMERIGAIWTTEFATMAITQGALSRGMKGKYEPWTKAKIKTKVITKKLSKAEIKRNKKVAAKDKLTKIESAFVREFGPVKGKRPSFKKKQMERGKKIADKLAKKAALTKKESAFVREFGPDKGKRPSFKKKQIEMGKKRYAKLLKKASLTKKESAFVKAFGTNKIKSPREIKRQSELKRKTDAFIKEFGPIKGKRPSEIKKQLESALKHKAFEQKFKPPLTKAQTKKLLDDIIEINHLSKASTIPKKLKLTKNEKALTQKSKDADFDREVLNLFDDVKKIKLKEKNIRQLERIKKARLRKGKTRNVARDRLLDRQTLEFNNDIKKLKLKERDIRQLARMRKSRVRKDKTRDSATDNKLLELSSDIKKLKLKERDIRQLERIKKSRARKDKTRDSSTEIGFKRKAREYFSDVKKLKLKERNIRQLERIKKSKVKTTKTRDSATERITQQRMELLNDIKKLKLKEKDIRQLTRMQKSRTRKGKVYGKRKTRVTLDDKLENAFRFIDNTEINIGKKLSGVSKIPIKTTKPIIKTNKLIKSKKPITKVKKLDKSDSDVYKDVEVSLDNGMVMIQRVKMKMAPQQMEIKQIDAKVKQASTPQKLKIQEKVVYKERIGLKNSRQQLVTAGLMFKNLLRITVNPLQKTRIKTQIKIIDGQKIKIDELIKETVKISEKIKTKVAVAIAQKTKTKTKLRTKQATKPKPKIKIVPVIIPFKLPKKPVEKKKKKKVKKGVKSQYVTNPVPSLKQFIG